LTFVLFSLGEFLPHLVNVPLGQAAEHLVQCVGFVADPAFDLGQFQKRVAGFVSLALFSEDVGEFVDLATTTSLKSLGLEPISL
jgi:hypothetical protein